MRQTKAQIMADVEEYTSAKFVDRNTVRYERPDGCTVIRLHNTDILTFENGGIVFNSGGWRTPTTLGRMNAFQESVEIWGENRVWYAKARCHQDGKTVFADGMRYDSKTGTLTSNGKIPSPKLIKDIRDFAKRCVEAMPLDMPSSEDCWYCYFKWGTDNDHLLSHVRERYVVPSLIWTILKDKGCDPQGQGCVPFIIAFQQGEDGDGIRQSLSASLMPQMGRWIYDYMYEHIVNHRN